jgi:preprotein translocase subunit SecF
MTRVVNFTKIRFLMVAISIVVVIGGIVGTVTQGGFNLGIDFEAGLNQRVQVAPVGLTISYTGTRDATVNVEENTMVLEFRGEEGVEEQTLPFSDYGTLGEIADELQANEELEIELQADAGTQSSTIVTGLRFPEELGSEPVAVNIRNQNESEYVAIEEVRAALDPLGAPQVQVVGEPYHQEFMIRIADPSGEMKDRLESRINELLEGDFGQNTVVTKRSDYVGPQFSETLARQSISLIILALVLILIYIWFRFRFGYAISAIAALTHDVLIMLGFIGTTQLEVSTTTIAAVLTIIGYSLNDTIVVFDRVRENEGLLQGRSHTEIINTSITQSLSRTLITSLTTMLAVLALYFFGSGPIKDFALNLIVGIIVGTYSSIYIASPALLGWWNSRYRKQRRKQGLPAEPTEKEMKKKVEESAPEEEGATQKPAAAASRVSDPTEIPAAERKLKGKRQKKKKKK